MLPAYAGTSRPGPDPDSNTHSTSVRPHGMQSAGGPVAATVVTVLMPLRTL